jgi:hypothetical protein
MRPEIPMTKQASVADPGCFYLGSGSQHFFIPDPGSGSEHFSSWIPDPTKKRNEK